ncbi:Fe2+/Zn2+ regulated transporter [Stemphylium lycopersici]|nr:zinc-regulated transporter 1 [Stemphylium lycopersici]RAR03499.1 Fe2+/Zn2+ regulated transporter [Stemphylium lycopersici]
MTSATIFDPTHVDLTTANQADIVCYFSISSNEYNGLLSLRISSIFVIGLVSTLVTCFPVIARRKPSWKIPLGLYTFARFFGSGVIIATAFIHLLDPAYEAIGPGSCVAASGAWAEYPWCAAIVLVSIVAVFCVDLGAEVYVERRFGVVRVGDEGATGAFLRRGGEDGAEVLSDTGAEAHQCDRTGRGKNTSSLDNASIDTTTTKVRLSFAQQIGAFLVLEFGIIFHSVIIGLNLGVVASSTFTTLYPVLVFHQSFEGLGIGARLSTIPFPSPKSWMPWALCALYGLTTPVAIAIGLGVRTTYMPESKVSMIVQGVLNAVSAGFLIYSGLVELLAKDFLFDKERTRNLGRLGLMVGYVFVGAAVMAVIGYWA